MSVIEAVVVVLAGLAAGTINTVVGSGTLITFPTLLFLGYPPVAANITNSLGLSFSGLTAVRGYGDELRQVRPLVKQMLPMSLAGSVVGALLLLWLPAEAFAAIVPVLIAIALLLVAFGPRLNRWLGTHHLEGPLTGGHRIGLLAGTAVVGVYGGYFGAAQGVLLMGLMNVLLSGPLIRLNVIKNILGPAANFLSSIVFIIVAFEQVRWGVAALLAIGALGGGLVGAKVGRHLHPMVLRGLIITIGLVAIVKVVWFD